MTNKIDGVVVEQLSFYKPDVFIAIEKRNNSIFKIFRTLDEAVKFTKFLDYNGNGEYFVQEWSYEE